MAKFLVVYVSRAYNDIVGAPFVYEVQGVVCTYHLTMLYVSNLGATTKLRGYQEMAKSC